MSDFHGSRVTWSGFAAASPRSQGIRATVLMDNFNRNSRFSDGLKVSAAT
jgi:hypothetical protein